MNLVRRFLLTCSFVVVIAAPQRAAGDPLHDPTPAVSYFPGPTLVTALDPREPVVADFNGDGAPDFAVVGATGAVSVFLGAGNGTFGPRVDFRAVPAGSGLPTSLEVADLNNDGYGDLISANFNISPPPGSVSVLLGNGDGSFGPSRQFSVGDGPQSARAADMNLDGAIDVVATNGRSNTVSVLLGNGDGTLQSARDFPTGENPRDLAIGDFNEDGFPDVLVADFDPYACSLLLGNGDGTLQPRSILFAAAHDVAVGQLNGDPHLDLVACTGAFNTAEVFLGSGDGAFATAGALSLAIHSFDLELADLNLDGTLDVAALGQQGDTPQIVSIFLNHGDATFEPRSEFTIGTQPTAMTIGRLDPDPFPDIIIADRSSHTVTLWLTSPSLADLPPVVTAPTSVAGMEGVPLTVNVTVSDPDAEEIGSFNAFGLPPGAAFTADASLTSGTLDWTPDFTQAGSYNIVFRATNALTGIATTRLVIANTNRDPVANAGGPYTGTPGVPISFSGSESSDPDGDALTFAWDFGDGGTGAGATPAHAYAAAGSYNVTLRVTDPDLLFADAVTTSTVTDFVAANVFYAFNLNFIFPQIIPTWVRVEPVGGSFNVSEILASTATMTYNGVSIPTKCKSGVSGDANHNGVTEVRVCFARNDLRNLFEALPNGTSNVVVTVRGNLVGGGTFGGDVAVHVIKFSWLGAGALASVSPNPLNPQATLSFVTTQPGTATVQIFDLRGRLIRNVMPRQYLMPGVHDVTLDGRNEQGNRLATGVYFYRVESVDGASRGNFTVLK